MWENKRKVGNGHRSGFCFAITEISYLVVCISHDLVEPPFKNNKQQRSKKIISINDVRSPDLYVTFMQHASEEIASGQCIGLSCLEHKIQATQ